eukprot:NODE_5590_length_399_cov_66.100000_g4897_i0.p1 GENE.NODE_5590_length_399_cov_66.100000_g4897_i0~~NODE_5590_length_399_cov_66.100000_g4897_i0.p1  ORF type:complete len:78 (-),score=8.30 NODE_5590_length_399_cov_66.100000_g4897_i0:23-256(-)
MHGCQMANLHSTQGISLNSRTHAGNIAFLPGIVLWIVEAHHVRVLVVGLVVKWRDCIPSPQYPSATMPVVQMVCTVP